MTVNCLSKFNFYLALRRSNKTVLVYARTAQDARLSDEEYKPTYYRFPQAGFNEESCKSPFYFVHNKQNRKVSKWFGKEERL